jgi:hypothetical protein
MSFAIKARYKDADYEEFAEYVKDIQNKIDFKVSARGWCYLLEGERLINKNEFDRVEGLINTCRERGYLPIDFVADEDARAFKGVEKPEEESVIKNFGYYLQGALNVPNHYTPDWWEGEEYYIQTCVRGVPYTDCKQQGVEFHVAKG